MLQWQLRSDALALLDTEEDPFDPNEDSRGYDVDDKVYINELRCFRTIVGVLKKEAFSRKEWLEMGLTSHRYDTCTKIIYQVLQRKDDKSGKYFIDEDIGIAPKKLKLKMIKLLYVDDRLAGQSVHEYDKKTTQTQRSANSLITQITKKRDSANLFHKTNKTILLIDSFGKKSNICDTKQLKIMQNSENSEKLVFKWLKSIFKHDMMKRSKYANLLLKNGYNDMKKLCLISRSELDEMNIKAIFDQNIILQSLRSESSFYLTKLTLKQLSELNAQERLIYENLLDEFSQTEEKIGVRYFKILREHGYTALKSIKLLSLHDLKYLLGVCAGDIKRIFNCLRTCTYFQCACVPNAHDYQNKVSEKDENVEFFDAPSINSSEIRTNDSILKHTSVATSEHEDTESRMSSNSSQSTTICTYVTNTS